jgi:hypothetical protein
MIPVKILSPKQAEKLGLKKKEKGFGRNFGVSSIVSGKHGEPGKLQEQFIITENNKKELIFMSDERKQELKSRRQFSNYIKQFNKIPRGLK